MIKKKKTFQKDKYGRYIKSKDFDVYWDEYHELEDISMKESVRQKIERTKKIETKEEHLKNLLVDLLPQYYYNEPLKL